MSKKEKIVARLAQSSSQAEPERQFDIAADILLLKEKYTRLNKRDYLQLLAALHKKYAETEQEIVHAALVARCKAGDAAAIKLYYELRTETGGGDGNEVMIVDDIG